MDAKKIIFLFGLIVASASVSAQPYRVYPFPNVWWNSVDQIRVGLHFKGQMKGTLDDGPHRLIAGIWLGTALPDNPFSYYVELTEPIYYWSTFGNEAAFVLKSQFRTGFEAYELAIKKRMQKGFLESEFSEHKLTFAYHDFYTADYALIKPLVTANPVVFVDYTFNSAHENTFLEAKFRAGFEKEEFLQMRILVDQIYEITKWLSFHHKNRIVLQGNAIPKHLQEFTAVSSYNEQLLNPFFRARGTVPFGLVKTFPVLEAAHAGTRADLDYEFHELLKGKTNPSKFIYSTNLEAFLESPLTHAFSKWKFVGDLFELKHYLFFDLSIASTENVFVVYDASSIYSIGSGFGFSVSLIKQKSNPFLKAFSVKYELPVWRLGNPDTINGLSLRHILSLSGTITF